MTTGPETPPPDPQHDPTAGPPPWQAPGQAPGPPPGPPPGYPPQAPYAPQPPLRPDEEKLWAIGAHLGPLLLGFIAPLVVWLVFKDRSPWLDRQGKEALNFQLTLMIGYLVCVVLMVVLIGFLLAFLLWVGSIVLMVLATVKVASFEDYRYPLTIRFLR